MHPYRKERIASVIHQIVGEAIVHRLHDPRLEPLTTVMRVEMSVDLLIARVFVTVPGGKTMERKTLAALVSATGFIQRMVAKGLQIRHCPELRFQVDTEVARVNHTLGLLEANRRDRPDLFDAADDEDDGDKNGGGDDTNEDDEHLGPSQIGRRDGDDLGDSPPGEDT